MVFERAWVIEARSWISVEVITPDFDAMTSGNRGSTPRFSYLNFLRVIGDHLCIHVW